MVVVVVEGATFGYSREIARKTFNNCNRLKKRKKSSALWKAIPRHTVQSQYREQLQAGWMNPSLCPQTEDLPGSPSASFSSRAAWDVLDSFPFSTQ